MYKKKLNDEKKFEKKYEDLKIKEVKILYFDKYLRKTNNEINGNKSMDMFFKKK